MSALVLARVHGSGGHCLLPTEHFAGFQPLRACAHMCAAQHYLQAEMDAQDLDFGGFEENLTEAVDCYEFAINIYKGIQRNSFAATLHSELAQALMAFGRLEEATMHFRNAAELLTESPLPATSALENAIECSVCRGSDAFSGLRVVFAPWQLCNCAWPLWLAHTAGVVLRTERSSRAEPSHAPPAAAARRLTALGVRCFSDPARQL